VAGRSPQLCIMTSCMLGFASRLAVVVVVTLGMIGVAPAQMGRVGAPQSTAPQPEISPLNAPVSIQQDVPYGTVNSHPLLLDIYTPGEHSSTWRPAVVLIHGGTWSGGEKGTMRGMASFLARSGFVAFAVDYRLFNGKENLWPAQLDDVQRAVRWIRANAAKYGVNPDYIGAFGHSAGAQLAALLGMEAARDNSDPLLAKYSSRVQAVVDVSGPSDFTADPDVDRDAFLASFFGGNLAQHGEIWRDASPAFHVAKNDAPFLIFHGTLDNEVPIAQSQELADKLKQAGVSVKFVKVKDAHTFESPEVRWQLALESEAFFAQNLRLAIM
jgi:acetyl esterase/lipase